MKELSHIAQAVQASTTMAIDSMFKQMKADGIDVIGFGAGEPDFNTPDEIKEAGIQAIQNNITRYTPAAGTVELRQAVCDRMKADCNVEYKPNQVVVTSGAKHAVYLALRALVDPGDEVILPAPYWVSYIELIRMVGGVPVVVTATEKENFKLTPEKLAAAITPKTKALILNNPSNPTGMMYGAEELKGIAKVCIENDLYVISDEIYYGLVYDGAKFTSFASISPETYERTILINGVSKSYAMTGWRIGYACADSAVAKVMANYVSHSTGSPVASSQKASVTALTGSQAKIELMRQAFEERRNYLVDRMNKIPGVSCIKPEGAFYVMMNLEQLIGKTIQGVTITDDNVFADAFLKKGLVAVVPGSGFGAPNFTRWSYATSMENIKEGLDRLEKFLAE
ncbi:pyridoxal phosphate-dependent aminotransferase [Pseudoflavonifractor sp. MSJ-37]|uniref:pyridoxal phosphate-dependent aminotransferase n=1 Tax=Pseudoflavonifractor sp. MSJ-37 TaxID=2841531 RepID=UPI001C11AFFD|nr:pyridoxal phosphate-dependent aminotransferase [Pseudoflavonifractor sp. MSJ-37]MBU5434759.1 pyridoxal phosphate-dependent aminotransferase [Pseudoflavonifractor sp. MSJ-37]